MSLSDFTARDYGILAGCLSFAALCLRLAWLEHCHFHHLRQLKRQAEITLNGRPC